MNYLTALAVGVIGGLVFSVLHLPLPWTLGPMLAVIVVRVGLKRSIQWPAQFRNIAMAVLGYAMGRSFTPETGRLILGLFPFLVIAAIITTLLSLLGGAIITKLTGVNLTTGLLGSVPGGLTQMAAICEDIPDADVSAITLQQTVRMLVVVFLVPFISLHLLSHGVIQPQQVFTSLGKNDIVQLTLFTGIITVCIYLTKYIKISSPYIILPIIITALLVLWGINAPALPPSVIKIAQVFVGIRMGLGVNLTNLTDWKSISLFSLLSNLFLLLTLAAVDYFFTKATPISFVTAFIATAPGGMTEMGLTAMSVQANLSTVIAFQLFRLLFVLLVAIPLLSWWLRRRPKTWTIKHGLMDKDSKM